MEFCGYNVAKKNMFSPIIFLVSVYDAKTFKIGSIQTNLVLLERHQSIHKLLVGSFSNNFLVCIQNVRGDTLQVIRSDH